MIVSSVAILHLGNYAENNNPQNYMNQNLILKIKIFMPQGFSLRKRRLVLIGLGIVKSFKMNELIEIRA